MDSIPLRFSFNAWTKRTEQCKGVAWQARKDSGDANTEEKLISIPLFHTLRNKWRASSASYAFTIPIAISCKTLKNPKLRQSFPSVSIFPPTLSTGKRPRNSQLGPESVKSLENGGNPALMFGSRVPKHCSKSWQDIWLKEGEPWLL